MSTSTKCRAKNPDTCPRHGTKQLFAEKLFEQALQRNSRVTEMEKIILWRRELFRSLETKRPQHISEELEGLSHYRATDVEKLRAFNTEYETLLASLTETEVDALKQYTGMSYSTVNQYLRDEKTFRANSKPEYLTNRLAVAKYLTEQLDAVFQKGAGVQRTTYRYITPDLDVMDIPSSEEYAKQLQLVEGKQVTFKSYLSTTVDPHLIGRYAAENKEENVTVVLVINSNRGIPVGRTATNRGEGIYTQDTEREILLPRDMTFKVEKVTRETGFPTGPLHSNSRTVNPLTVYLTPVD